MVKLSEHGYKNGIRCVAQKPVMQLRLLQKVVRKYSRIKCGWCLVLPENCGCTGRVCCDSFHLGKSLLMSYSEPTGSLSTGAIPLSTEIDQAKRWKRKGCSLVNICRR
jgi:hypothetical protein